MTDLVGELDLTQPAIVFWVGRPGELTRFEHLREAIYAVMQMPLAPTANVAWIRTTDRHITMEEIRKLASRFSLSWRLTRIGAAKKVKRFWWPSMHDSFAG
jgi:hypothetical protein